MIVWWQNALDWMKAHPAAVTWITGSSLLLFLGSLFALPWILRAIPADYFDRNHVPLRETWFRSTWQLRLWIVGKNVLAAILAIMGILMFFLPGQGLLTLLAGLFLSDLPFRKPLLHTVLRRPLIREPVNRLRAKRQIPPIKT